MASAMPTYVKYLIAAIVASAAIWQQAKSKKDGTAQGVAKVRHGETILEDPAERLYEDPYAEGRYPGSFVQAWLGGRRTRRLFDYVMPGLFDLLTLRTKWFDDQIIIAALSDGSGRGGAAAAAAQLVILGAGYDTRGFRLNLPAGFLTVDIDQPSVQAKKRQILAAIAEGDASLASRLRSRQENPEGPRVEHLEIDFNKDSVAETMTRSSLSPNSSFDRTKRTVVTLEGVSQYIPKESTATTLKEVHGVLSHGSLLLISYVLQTVMDRPEDYNLSSMLKQVRAKKGFYFFVLNSF